MNTPSILREETMGEWKFLELKKLTLGHPNGDISSYEMVARNSQKVFGIIAILPITTDNELILIRQYRAPLDTIVLELPAWCAEKGKHHTLRDAVDAELLEETWYCSQDIDTIAQFSSSSGMTNETVCGYIARNCTKVTDILDLDKDEYIERILVPLSKIDQFITSEIMNGNIIEPKMLAMLYISKSRGLI